MKTIKFRAWNKVSLCFEKEFRIDQNGNWIGNEGVWNPEDAGYVLMQFTGLRDKNGKDIYEGDIINAYDHPTNLDSIKGKEVVYVACAFKDSYNGYVLQDSYTNIEIIGNIHENPELL